MMKEIKDNVIDFPFPVDSQVLLPAYSPPPITILKGAERIRQAMDRRRLLPNGLSNIEQRNLEFMMEYFEGKKYE